MTVDASKLKRIGRRGLGSPPTNGSIGIDGTEEWISPTSDGSGGEATNSARPTAGNGEMDATAFRSVDEDQLQRPHLPSMHSGDDAAVRPEHPTATALHRVPSGSEAQLAEPEDYRSSMESVTREHSSPGEEVKSRLRHRVPLGEIEPRVPFTTRITLSSKERLEEACYHLRRKHQDFINEAIIAYLEKHGF